MRTHALMLLALAGTALVTPRAVLGAAPQATVDDALNTVMLQASRERRHILGVVIRPPAQQELEPEITTLRSQLIQAANAHPGVEKVVTLDDPAAMKGVADMQLAQDAGNNGMSLMLMVRLEPGFGGPLATLALFDARGVELANTQRVLAPPAAPAPPDESAPQAPPSASVSEAPSPSPPTGVAPPVEPLTEDAGVGRKVDAAVFLSGAVLSGPPLLLGVALGTLGALLLSASSRNPTLEQAGLREVGLAFCLSSLPCLCVGCVPVAVGVGWWSVRRGAAARSAPAQGAPSQGAASGAAGVILVGPGAQYAPPPQDNVYVDPAPDQPANEQRSAPAPSSRSAPNAGRAQQSPPAQHGGGHVGGQPAPSSGNTGGGRGPAHVTAPPPPPQKKQEKKDEKKEEKKQDRKEDNRIKLPVRK